MYRQQLLAKMKQVILAEYPFSTEKIKLHNNIFHIELETGELLNVIIHTKQEWHNPFMQATPFYERVVKEGVLI